jgi:hypothetical protein
MGCRGVEWREAKKHISRRTEKALDSHCCAVAPDPMLMETSFEFQINILLAEYESS